MRSYPRYRSHRVSFDFFITPGVQLLVLANVAVFIVQVLVYTFMSHSAYDSMLKLLGLVPYGVVPGLRIWQPFTYLFLHSVQDIWHILTNMFMLWMFGRELELVWGRDRFLRYYFLCGVGAGLINVIVKTVPLAFGGGPSMVATIGASGAIFGVLIANAILFPDRQVILLPIPIKLRMRTLVTGMIVLEFLLTLGSGGDKISHICHLGGILVGWLYLRRGSFLYRARNRFADWKQQRTRRKFEVYMRDHRKEPPPPDHWVN